MRRRGCGIGFERGISLVLIALVILSQRAEAYAGQSATTPAQEPNPPKLNIVIIEGDGAINNVRQRVAREVIVQVNDENNRPIGGGLVAFLLPSSGPGGLFSNGTNVLNITTDAAGRATAQFTPNAVSGAFQVNVSASFQGQVSTAVIPQTNGLAAASGAAAGGAATGVGTGTGISAATVAIVAAVVGAVVVGVVVASGKGDDKPSPTLPTPTIRIGAAGTPTVGTPGFQKSSTARPVPKWR